MEENKLNLNNNQEDYIDREKFDYTGLDTTVAYRFENESYKEYKVRQKVVREVYKMRLRGYVLHDSKNGTYIKPKENGV